MKDSTSIKRCLPKKEPKGEIVSTFFVGSSFLGNSSKIKTVEHLVKGNSQADCCTVCQPNCFEDCQAKRCDIAQDSFCGSQIGKFQFEETTSDWESAAFTQDLRQVLVFVWD